MKHHWLRPLHMAGARTQACWHARPPQERRFLAVGGGILLATLGYTVLLAPALNGRSKLASELPALRLQAAELQAMAQQAAALKSQVGPAPVAMTRTTLTASLTSQGLNAQSVSVTGEFAHVQLDGVPFAALLAWIGQQRRELRAAVQEASITPQPSAGMVKADLTLRQLAPAPIRP